MYVRRLSRVCSGREELGIGSPNSLWWAGKHPGLELSGLRSMGIKYRFWRGITHSPVGSEGVLNVLKWPLVTGRRAMGEWRWSRNWTVLKEVSMWLSFDALRNEKTLYLQVITYLLLRVIVLFWAVTRTLGWSLEATVSFRQPCWPVSAIFVDLKHQTINRPEP